MNTWIWIFTLIMDVWFPIFMIVFGNKKKAPEDINGSIGHKTAMARKNRDTWEFAHQHDGKSFRMAGWIMLVVSLIIMLLAIIESNHILSKLGIYLFIIQFLVYLGCVVSTEVALRKTFDENGNRR